MTFEELNLPPYIMRAIQKLGFEEPTEIQRKTIPAIFEKKDVIGKSATGSGKTFAYGIPAIDSIDTSSKATQVLVVCPTRELAMQVSDELRKLSEFKEGCRVVPVFGGSSMERQIDALKKGARIVVGTPGRINDHLRRKTLRLKNVNLLVLDEADEMLDMGFRDEVEDILKETNPYRQTVMFSATMPEPILRITKEYMKDPELVEINKTNENVAISQYFVHVGQKDKSKALVELIGTLKPSLSIVFCNTKKMVDSVTELLQKSGVNALGLHGDMRQAERKRVMQSVKSGETNLLVATDVAARGIDITDVDVVFNYDLPKDPDYYVHRIGRTGRAGKTGRAYTLINTSFQLDEMRRTAKTTDNDVKEYFCSYSRLSESQLPGLRPDKKRGKKVPYHHENHANDESYYENAKRFGDGFDDRKKRKNKKFDEKSEKGVKSGERTSRKTKGYSTKKSEGNFGTWQENTPQVGKKRPNAKPPFDTKKKQSDKFENGKKAKGYSKKQNNGKQQKNYAPDDYSSSRRYGWATETKTEKIKGKRGTVHVFDKDPFAD